MRLAWVLVFAALPGCAEPDALGQHDSDRQITRLESRVEDLLAEIEELKDRYAIQSERLAELEHRDRRLSAMVRDLQFDKRMLELQVGTLAEAPGQRDRLAEENRRLREEIETLKERLRTLREESDEPVSAEADNR